MGAARLSKTNGEREDPTARYPIEDFLNLVGAPRIVGQE
jgi:hypothetical protein